MSRPSLIIPVENQVRELDPKLLLATVAARRGFTSILGSHLNFGDSQRGWDFVSPGRGDAKWDPIFRALNRIPDGAVKIESVGFPVREPMLADFWHDRDPSVADRAIV